MGKPSGVAWKDSLSNPGRGQPLSRRGGAPEWEAGEAGGRDRAEGLVSIPQAEGETTV